MLEPWLLRRWYGGARAGMGLRALAFGYGLGLRLRAWLLRRGLLHVHHLRVPVVVVGNYVAGGTGKTPLTIALARSLAERGWRPGIVSRGYGRRSREPVRVHPHLPAEVCGDEPLLIARHTGLPVFVDSDRVSAARRLVSEGCNLILADDGLQHRRLGRDLEIEVIDGQRRYGNGLLLPAGPLREWPAPTGFRVVNGGDTSPGEWPVRLHLQDALPLEGGEARALSSFRGNAVHAVAGIGSPSRFFQSLRDAGIEVIEHPFPDHHVFVTGDLRFSPPGVILMTEKDAVKCADLAPPDSWSVPGQLELPPGLVAAIDERLAEWSCANAEN